MKTSNEVENLEILLIQMIEDQTLSEDDYNLIHKYLVKVKNDLQYKGMKRASCLFYFNNSCFV